MTVDVTLLRKQAAWLGQQIHPCAKPKESKLAEGLWNLVHAILDETQGKRGEVNLVLEADAIERDALLRDVLHQLTTDSDLDTITGAKTYRRIAEEIRKHLNG